MRVSTALLLIPVIFMIASTSSLAVDKDKWIASMNLKLIERKQSLTELETLVGTPEADTAAAAICDAIKKAPMGNEFEGPLHFSLLGLGALKSSKGIPTLLEFLTFVPTGYSVDERILTEQYFPAVVALSQIGEPVLVEVMRMVQNPKSTDQQKHLGAWILMQVVGTEKAIKIVHESPTQVNFSNGHSIEGFLLEYKPSFEYPHPSRDWTKP
jgi:hypothetical protein